jgi:flagellar assembly factor FliW
MGETVHECRTHGRRLLYAVAGVGETKTGSEGRTLRVDTERFGVVEVEESATIEMAAPILGFPATNSYALVDAGEDSPFTWLQSVQQPELAFAAVDPFAFFADYDFELPRADQDDLRLESGEGARVLVLVSIPADVQNMSANLVAPVVINTKSRRAKQVVLYDTPYTTRHYLLPEAARKAVPGHARAASDA